MQKVQITSPGIKKALKRYDPSRAIAEYVWNGFDAGASSIELIVGANEIGNISEIFVKDNGYGIAYEDLNNKFLPFFESEKELRPRVHRSPSAVHGKNGVGRLTFFQFATYAIWDTTYLIGDQAYSYEITIRADDLNTYEATEPKPTTKQTGTSVKFVGIHSIIYHNFESDIKKYLTREFGWFLELNETKDYQIQFNGERFDYTDIIGDKDRYTFEEGGSTFDIRFVRWNVNLNKEFSRYYFIDSNDKEVGKDTTTLNKKGDKFYHSIFIKSAYFDLFSNEFSANQISLLGHTRNDEIFQNLLRYIDQILRAKRKPFLRKYTDKLIDDFEKQDVFPRFGKNEWDSYRKQELEGVIRELYQVEPKLFTGLNIEQKKTFVYFLNLIMG